MFDMTKEGESAVKNKTKELCLLDNFDGRTVNGKTRFREDPMEFGLLEVEENGYNVLFIDKAVPYEGLKSDQVVKGASALSEPALQDDREVVAATQVIVDAPLKIQDEGRITDRQIEDRRSTSCRMKDDREVVAATQVIVDTPLKIQDEGRIADRQIED
nr:hypothetical protein BaRGS_030391 [Batillaria attramentaria]